MRGLWPSMNMNSHYTLKSLYVVLTRYEENKQTSKKKKKKGFEGRCHNDDMVLE